MIIAATKLDSTVMCTWEDDEGSWSNFYIEDEKVTPEIQRLLDEDMMSQEDFYRRQEL